MRPDQGFKDDFHLLVDGTHVHLFVPTFDDHLTLLVPLHPDRALRYPLMVSWSHFTFPMFVVYLYPLIN